MAFQCQANQLRENVQKLNQDKKVLNDQLMICKQELNMLGKRSIVISPEEATKIEEAVGREIKRRRKCNVGSDTPVTL